jgi:hypothetical protein
MRTFSTARFGAAAQFQHFNVKPICRTLGNGFGYVCWRRPSLLSEANKEGLYQSIIGVASQTFGDDMTPYWKGRAADKYLEKVTRVFLVMDARQLVGWTGYHRWRVNGHTCIYIDATGMLPHLQKSGVMTQLFGSFLAYEFLRNRLRPIFIAMRSESPVVYHAFFRVVGMQNIYPNLQQRPTPEAVEIGMHVAKWLHQDEKFEPTTFRVRNAFDGPCPWRWSPTLEALKVEHPVCPDQQINSFFAEQLQPEDAFIIVAKMEASMSAKLLVRALRQKYAAKKRPL